VFVEVASELIRGAQAGERQALVRLVELYQGPVYSLALAVMRDPVDAADMTQETFVRVLRSIGDFRGDSQHSFSSWVHRLTVNICLDALRRRQHTPIALDQDNEAAPALRLESRDRWEQPEWRAESDESAAEVRAALAELPQPQRLALTLHYFEDRRYDEIAAAMGVPLNTVKSHILRGKERMARLLDRSRFQPALPRLSYAAAGAGT
jgi:RNA polymerase sigma-70 factor (ECF subfamily)